LGKGQKDDVWMSFGVWCSRKKRGREGRRGGGGAKVRVANHAWATGYCICRQKGISTRSKTQHEHQRYPAMLQIIMVS